MYGSPMPFSPNNVPWNCPPPQNRQWRPNFGARAPFGHRPRFNQFRPQLQQGNDNYWCETCDRGFPTEDILNKHKQQHQKCNIDGCQFVAHPKVITKHIQMQHSSGLYKKIANINKPEDIEKWREERRKRYPTKANIDKKAAILQEKIQRGEKMGLDRRHNINKDNAQGQGVKRKQNTSNENHQRSKFQKTNNNPPRKPRKITPKALPLVEDNRKLKPFAGISILVMDSDGEIEEPCEMSDLIEDDVCEESHEKSVEAKSEPTICGALSSLICDYGSSDEEDQNPDKCNDPQVKTDVKKISTSNNTKLTNGKVKSIQNMNSSNQESRICNSEKYNPNHVDKINPSPNDKPKPTADSNVQDNVISEKRTIDSSKNNSVLENVLPINGIVDPKAQENDDDSGPEEVKVVKDDSTNTVQAEPLSKGQRKKPFHEKKRTFHRPQPKLPSTLLHKLLFREMQQERNIVLQCIRYVRKNNYFDKN